MNPPRIERAILSVSDKLGLADFARGLVSAGVTLYSTGGTRKYLESNGIPVIDISDYTGFPEMMDGRLKTLHPKIAGGILNRHDEPEDQHAIAEHGIARFELVVVNLYPFEATIARPGVTDPEAIEQIDIGGPTMVRAAAKNHRFVTLVTATEQYARVLEAIQQQGGTSYELRRELAGAAFEMTARYDRAIADYFARTDASQSSPHFPTTLQPVYQLRQTLRYGENPHQAAALYAKRGEIGANLVGARQLSGKELSYNNLLDLDSALAIARLLPRAAAVVVKHNNPCGAASADDLATATKKALAGDPVSAFGGILAFNQSVDAATAEALCDPGLFLEAMVAPEFSPEALSILTTKPKWKANVRLLSTGPLNTPPEPMQVRHIDGGLLVQQTDASEDPPAEWRVVTEMQPDARLYDELRFAWAACRNVKSNAIVVSRDQSLAGVGAGQMSRVDSVEIAIRKSGARAKGGVLASDAFFPFDDSIGIAAAAGIAAIIQPGGSKRDDEVIAACNKHGLPMIFTGRRHFKH